MIQYNIKALLTVAIMKADYFLHPGKPVPRGRSVQMSYSESQNIPSPVGVLTTKVAVYQAPGWGDGFLLIARAGEGVWPIGALVRKCFHS